MKFKKEYIVILIIILVVMLGGATCGYFFLLVSNKEDSTELYTGTLDLKYLQGDVIYEQPFYPREEPSLDDLEYAYSSTFSITNTGTLDGLMQINLYVEKNEFVNDDLKYAIYNSDNVKIINGSILSLEKVTLLDNVLFKSQQSVQYTLIIWLQETGKQQNQNENKRLTASIVADMVQYIE